jgi:hypothetical protein
MMQQLIQRAKDEASRNAQLVVDKQQYGSSKAARFWLLLLKEPKLIEFIRCKPLFDFWYSLLDCVVLIIMLGPMIWAFGRKQRWFSYVEPAEDIGNLPPVLFFIYIGMILFLALLWRKLAEKAGRREILPLYWLLNLMESW